MQHYIFKNTIKCGSFYIYTIFQVIWELVWETDQKQLLLTDNPFHWKQTLKESVSQWVEIKKLINPISGQIHLINRLIKKDLT